MQYVHISLRITWRCFHISNFEITQISARSMPAELVSHRILHFKVCRCWPNWKAATPGFHMGTGFDHSSLSKRALEILWDPWGIWLSISNLSDWGEIRGSISSGLSRWWSSQFSSTWCCTRKSPIVLTWTPPFEISFNFNTFQKLEHGAAESRFDPFSSFFHCSR